MSIQKKLTIKLGNKCNFNCKLCHCNKEVKESEFNPDIIDFINNEYKPKRIHFCGGEPLLYWDTIVKIVNQIDVPYYGIVTNASMMTDSIANFCNYHNIAVAVSPDKTHYDESIRIGTPMNYKSVSKVINRGTSLVYTHDSDIIEINEYMRYLCTKLGLEDNNFSLNPPAFVHQTKDSPNNDITKEDVKKYITQLGQMLEIGIINYTRGSQSYYELGALNYFIRHFILHRDYEGFYRCCNPSLLSVDLSGRFLLCPYGDTYIGDIYRGVDWELLKSYKPDRCKLCKLFSICGNTCIANITDNECYIFKCLYKHYKKLIIKYNVDEHRLLSLEDWSHE